MKYLYPAILPLLFFSCQSKENQLPDGVKEQYFEATKAADKCTDLLEEYKNSRNFEDFIAVYEMLSSLRFDIDDSQLDEEQYNRCRRKKMTLDSLKREVNKVLQQDLSRHDVMIAHETDKLINSSFSVPFYAKRDEKLKLTSYSTSNYELKIYNVDSKQLLYKSNKKKQIEDVIHISNSAIYLLEFTCPSPSYIDFSLSKKASSIEELTQKTKVAIDTIPCQKGEFRAQKVDGVQLKNLFEEPRKVTLRSQGKALFSGSSRSLVAINIPAGTSDIMYSLRISTSDHDKASDGEFYDRTYQRYHQIKFLGLPIYESSRNSNSLLRELLSSSTPEREEEAYCSMYVFKTAGEARKFQNNKPINSLQYNLDYTIVGTQSCNGRIPVKGIRTLYLGFDNPKMSSSVYIWLEVIGAIRSTEYFKERYVIKK